MGCVAVRCVRELRCGCLDVCVLLPGEGPRKDVFMTSVVGLTDVFRDSKCLKGLDNTWLRKSAQSARTRKDFQCPKSQVKIDKKKSGSKLKSMSKTSIC